MWTAYVQIKNAWKQKTTSFNGLIIERPREELYQRMIRVIEMFNFAVEEIKALPKNLSETAKKAIGIGEIQKYLNGEISLEESISTIQKHTRNYAKRQITWFREKVDFKKFALMPMMIKFINRKNND